MTLVNKKGNSLPLNWQRAIHLPANIFSGGKGLYPLEALGTRVPTFGPISFIFMQFSAKIWSNNRFLPQMRGLVLPSGKSNTKGLFFQMSPRKLHENEENWTKRPRGGARGDAFKILPCVSATAHTHAHTHTPVADIHLTNFGCAPPRPNFFLIVQFLGKFGRVIGWHPSWKSWIRHCMLLLARVCLMHMCCPKC